jgi:hypothetical protein
MTHPVDEVVFALEEGLLEENPFPEAVTGRSSTFAARVEEWAEAARQRIVHDVEHLRGEAPGDEPAAWELAALQRAVHEWRVFETFRRLHEERWCPGLLFRLKTKTDLLILCDPEADSSKEGFGERQRRLAKRGVSGRFHWVEARRLVAALGLLEGTVRPALTEGDGASSRHAPKPVPDPDATAVLGDGLEAAPAPHPDGGSGPDDTPTSDGAGSHDTTISSSTLPVFHPNRVWSALPTYTKKQLEAVYERFGVGLWSQFGARFYSSMRKPEMLTFIQRVVRHHACLDAAHRLTESQLDALHDWMRFNLTERYQRDEDLRIAARLYADFQAGAALSRDGHGLAPEAWNRYRQAELRRIAAFCCHRFYEAETSAAHSDEAA